MEGDLNTAGRLQLVFIGLDENGKAFISPSVITARRNETVRFISKHDFQLEFFGRMPDDAGKKILRKTEPSKGGVVTMTVADNYINAQAEFTNFPDYFKRTDGGRWLPGDVAAEVRNFFADEKLSEMEVLDIIKKAPIEKPGEFYFIFFNVKICCQVIDPGMGIDPQ